jgi:hypothetical protein
MKIFEQQVLVGYDESSESKIIIFGFLACNGNAA